MGLITREEEGVLVEDRESGGQREGGKKRERQGMHGTQCKSAESM